MQTGDRADLRLPRFCSLCSLAELEADFPPHPPTRSATKVVFPAQDRHSWATYSGDRRRLIVARRVLRSQPALSAGRPIVILHRL